MATRTRFAGYPDAVAFEKPDGKKAVEHLLWGFWVGDTGVREGSYKKKDIHGVLHKGKYAQVKLRGHRQLRWIPEHQIQKERLLEVIFVDIGQGDGCLIVTPEDKHIVVDAGEGDNMVRFLRWRYGGFRQKFDFEAAVISHPDADHYKGFGALFDEPNAIFETVYHNGLMERYDATGLGKKKKDGKRSYVTELVTTLAELKAFLGKKTNWQKPKKRGGFSKKQYPAMLADGLASKSFKKFRMLSESDAFMPGYGADQDLSIQVLGPVQEPDAQGNGRLRWLSNKGKTKNGHSVLLRLQYHDVSFMLGGDLNIPSEKLLLEHHTRMEVPPDTEDEEALVEAAREVFEVDIAKSCHHGSSDFLPLYLKATNPVATIISSGDDEPHSHPRADALGSIGAYSRGARPLIFSTELARSAKELIKHPYIRRRELEEKIKEIKATESGDDQKKLLDDLEKDVGSTLNRSISVYGAISVITDGQKVVVAQKLERARSKSKKWDIYRLEREGNGPLRFQSKH
jgi:beta-lactamase superfamily II metal-dependent hydrolase